MDNIPDKKADGEGLGQAVRRRLARLATMPVDTSRLDAALRRRINRRSRVWLWWATPLAGVAAAIIVLVALVLASSTTPRLSAAELAGVYSHLTADGQPHNAGTGGLMNMPMNCRLMPGEFATCCRQTVAHQKVACMVIHTRSAKPLVLVMGNMRRTNMPAGRTVSIAGHSDMVARSGNVNMVMRRAGGHWFCAMGTQRPSVLAAYLDRAAGK